MNGVVEELTWMVGGEQGEGIDSTGATFASLMNRQGYFLYGYRNFGSRIKGGHTNYKLRIATHPVAAQSDHVDILLAFDQPTITINAKELREGAVVIADERAHPKLPEGVRASLYMVPLTQIAEEHGNRIMKNMVSLGATAGLMGLPVEAFYELMQKRFGRKGNEVVEQNMQAIAAGAAYIRQHYEKLEGFDLAPADGKSRYLMIGNEAMALGALTAGCRVMTAYPITPASDIMEYLVRKFPKVGGVMIQTEDEISAVSMAIGASYAGARAMTATSGPGFSLMAEGIGLSGMSETPIVVIDTERTGPSTGMPTRHEQSDLNMAIFGTHGDVQRIVLSPSTLEDAFYITTDAFNLADEYQVPVIVLADFALCEALQTTEGLDPTQVRIDRGSIMTDEQLMQLPGGGQFKRYAITPTGISPRTFPSQVNGIYQADGLEHSEDGHPTEDFDVRQKQMSKRLAKLAGFHYERAIDYAGPEQPDLLVVGFGSTRGVIDEALAQLRQEGHAVARLTLRCLWPFPAEEITPYLEAAQHIVVVENNAGAQLAGLIHREVGYHGKSSSLSQYNGRTFLPSQLVRLLKEWL